MTVKILRPGLTASTAQALQRLIVASGVDPSDIELIEDLPEQTQYADDEVIICVLGPELLAEPSLEASFLRAIGSGRRIVAVWPYGGAPVELPASFLKYCYSVVPWDAERLRPVLVEEDHLCFETQDGEPLEMPEPERRECP